MQREGSAIMAGMDRDTAEASRGRVPEHDRPAAHPPLAKRSLPAGVRGVVWMLLGMSCIGIVDGVAKFLAVRLHGIEVAWGYFVASFVCAAVYAFAKRASRARTLRSRRPWLQVGRAACLGRVPLLPLRVAQLPAARGGDRHQLHRAPVHRRPLRAASRRGGRHRAVARGVGGDGRRAHRGATGGRGVPLGVGTAPRGSLLLRPSSTLPPDCFGRPIRP